MLHVHDKTERCLINEHHETWQLMNESYQAFYAIERNSFSYNSRQLFRETANWWYYHNHRIPIHWKLIMIVHKGNWQSSPDKILHMEMRIVFSAESAWHTSPGQRPGLVCSALSGLTQWRHSNALGINKLPITLEKQHHDFLGYCQD